MIRRLWWSPIVQQRGARQSCGLERLKTIRQVGVTINICCTGESMTPTRQAQRRARIPQSDELSQLAWKYLRVAPEDVGGG